MVTNKTNAKIPAFTFAHFEWLLFYVMVESMIFASTGIREVFPDIPNRYNASFLLQTFS